MASQWSSDACVTLPVHVLTHRNCTALRRTPPPPLLGAPTHFGPHFGCIMSVTCRLHFMGNDPKPPQDPPGVGGNWGDATFIVVCYWEAMVRRIVRYMPNISRNVEPHFAVREMRCAIRHISCVYASRGQYNVNNRKKKPPIPLYIYISHFPTLEGQP